MKFLFLADESPGNAWLIREVEREIPLQAVIRPDWMSSPPPKPRQPAGLRSPWVAITRRIRRRYFARCDSQHGAALESLLFPASPLPVPTCPVIKIPWWQINDASVREQIRSLAPDLMFVCGAPLLRPEIFSLPRLGTVNLHSGISPNYRGQHTLLWPLLKRDYARIGATLHYINEGIDAGRVLFRCYPALEPGDNLVAIEAKVAWLATRLLVAFLRSLRAAAPGQPWPGKQFVEPGRLIRHGDRTIRDDLAFRLRRVAGHRIPAITERVELFYP